MDTRENNEDTFTYYRSVSIHSVYIWVVDFVSYLIFLYFQETGLVAGMTDKSFKSNNHLLRSVTQRMLKQLHGTLADIVGSVLLGCCMVGFDRALVCKAQVRTETANC